MKNNSALKAILISIGVIGLSVLVIIAWRFELLSAISFVNKTEAEAIKTDIKTDYKKQKEIEDTLRSYIASYEADKITYETNKDIDSEAAQELAIAAKTRANRTAATYNQYYLKNSYVWKDNIPEDINEELPYIE